MRSYFPLSKYLTTPRDMLGLSDIFFESNLRTVLELVNFQDLGCRYSHESRRYPWGLAWPAEFNQALAAVAPGDVIVFKNGSYSSLKLVFRAQGTEKLPITLLAVSAGGMDFTCNSRMFLDGNRAGP